jgi:biotin carboxylase
MPSLDPLEVFLMNDSDPVLLVAGSGARSYREYLLASMARSHRLWLLDAIEPTWQSSHLAGATTVDVSDAAALVRAAREVCASRPVLGLVCYDEAVILQAAHVVAALGLHGMTVDAVRRCRDKRLTRETLREAGIPQPVSIAVSCRDEAEPCAALTGYPLVLKPRGLGASEGVIRVEDAAGLTAGFHSAQSASHPGVPTYAVGVLVEEYLDGPEISIDGFVCDGCYQALFLAHKQVGLAPFFEETEHVVMAGDPLLHDVELLSMLSAAHRALGVDRGITHTEVRFTARGPRIVEVNGRLGGDLIPYLGWLATGVDPGVVAAQLATGACPRPEPTRQGCVGIRFCYPPEDCQVRSVDLPDLDPELGIVAAVALASPGTELRLPPREYVSRHSYVICEGRDLESCRRRLESAASRLVLDWRPSPVTPEPVAAHESAR